MSSVRGDVEHLTATPPPSAYPQHQLNIKAVNNLSPGLPNSSPFNHPCIHPIPPQPPSAAGNSVRSLSEPKPTPPAALPSSSEPLHPARNPAPRERAFLTSETFCQRFTQPQSCVFHQINAPPEHFAWHCGFAADSGVLIRLRRQFGDRVFKHEA